MALWAASRTGMLHLADHGSAACSRLIPLGPLKWLPDGTYRYCKRCAAFVPPPPQKLRLVRP